MVNIKYYLILLICMFFLRLGMVIGISLQNKNVLENNTI